jgi:hypothetical protein
MALVDVPVLCTVCDRNLSVFQVTQFFDAQKDSSRAINVSTASGHDQEKCWFVFQKDGSRGASLYLLSTGLAL